MDFKQIDIYTESKAVEQLADKLSDIGVSGFVIHDRIDFEEFLSKKNADWDYIDDELLNLAKTPTYITFYLPDDNQGAEMLLKIKALLSSLCEDTDFYGDLRLEANLVHEEDWENCWKEYYKPFKIGEKFVIKPTWEKADSEWKQDNRLILEIDPASAFGTGQHATTRLCIEALEELIFEGADVLDLGCGSGVLAVAALLLGCNRVCIADISENAVRIASENILLNGFDENRFSAYCGDVICNRDLREKLGLFDVITVNIVADVIIALSGFIGGFLKAGGVVVFSGIITDRLEEVKGALQRGGLIIAEIREKEGWNAVIAKGI